MGAVFSHLILASTGISELQLLEPHIERIRKKPGMGSLVDWEERSMNPEAQL